MNETVKTATTNSLRMGALDATSDKLFLQGRAQDLAVLLLAAAESVQVPHNNMSRGAMEQRGVVQTTPADTHQFRHRLVVNLRFEGSAGVTAAFANLDELQTSSVARMAEQIMKNPEGGVHQVKIIVSPKGQFDRITIDVG